MPTVNSDIVYQHDSYGDDNLNIVAIFFLFAT